jgi:peptidoglycan/xylan/chitin deacetylase (PgdA/CDA1 family)
MARSFKILAWHSTNILANTYAQNDQLAFASDLRTLDRCGARIWPLADALAALDAGTLPDGVVVLTCDDGSTLDYLPFDHPACGPQPGFHAILRDFARATGASEHRLHLSCFAIASPEARAALDRKDYRGLGLWHDAWWRDANATGLMGVESHTWDHNHPSVDRTCQRDNRRGDFRWIDTEDECRCEIDAASDYIEHTAGRRPRFLAHPYGKASDYLIREYLPRFGRKLGLEAALGCMPRPVNRQSDRWNLPRYMCNHDWKSPGELERLLGETQDVAAELDPFIVITEMAEGAPFAEPIFRRKYNAAAPQHGHHLFAWHRAGEDRWNAAAYLNYLPFKGAMLIGGASTDGRVVRAMAAGEQAAIAKAGGLMLQLVRYGEARFEKESVGTFGHCGDARSWSVLSQCGYIRLDDPHLIVRWNREPEPAAREALFKAVKSIGPF